MRNMGQIYIWKCGWKIIWTDKKKWDGPTYQNVDGEILETGTRDYL